MGLRFKSLQDLEKSRKKNDTTQVKSSQPSKRTNTTKKTEIPIASETSIHKAIIQWLKLQKYNNRPLSDYVHHSPNGGFRYKKQNSKGKYYSPEGKKLKDMGTQKGYPDLLMDIPKGEYHGLRIELKNENGVLSPEQKERLILLNEQGYYAFVGDDIESIIATIQGYLALP